MIRRFVGVLPLLSRFPFFSGDKRIRTLDAELRRRGFTFSQLASMLGYRPRRRDLFLEALLHRSFLPITDGTWTSNERLEFLGDAILNFLVADHLYRSMPDQEEGELTKLRSRLVNRRILAQRSRALGLNTVLLLSASAAQSLDSGAESIVADAFESVIGAIYLDGGLEEAREFVDRTLLSAVDLTSVAALDDNYKSALLEYAQSRSLGIPRYNVLKEEGPEHDRRFTIEVTLGSDPYGIGSGRSKKDAEQAAAAQALEKIHKELPLSTEPPISNVP